VCRWNRKDAVDDAAKKRAYRRIDVRLKVFYRLVRGTQSIEETEEGVVAYTKNISAGGLLIETAERLQAGGLLYAKFKLTPADEAMEALCRVCWIRDGTEDSTFYAGLAFLALASKERARVDQFVISHATDEF
jgi:c-di-GMP-binding flagellar brake protein YcgR